MDKIYNEKASENPTVEKTGSTKDVIFTWYQKQTDGSFKDISSAPVNVGSYKVVASIDTDINFNSTSAEKEFTITKGVPKYQIPMDLSMKQSDKLSEVKLTDGFSWKDETQTADKYGKQTFKAIFTPTDTENHQIVEVDITVDVLPLPILVNHAPVITVEDKELMVGDTFNDTIALQGVTAIDKEDGNITESIEVIKKTVDTTKAGTYEVTYKITDSQGVSATKTIKVSVKEKENTDNNKSSTDKENVKIGDDTNFGLYTSMITISGLLITILAVLKKKKALENK